MAKPWRPTSTRFRLDGLLPETAYDARVCAFDASSGEACATVGPVVTLPEGADPPVLDANGHKIKGVQHADLSWSGGSGAAVDILRDGQYRYEVCEQGTTVCSAPVAVVF